MEPTALYRILPDNTLGTYPVVASVQYIDSNEVEQTIYVTDIVENNQVVCIPATNVGIN